MPLAISFRPYDLYACQPAVRQEAIDRVRAYHQEVMAASPFGNDYDKAIVT